MTRLINQQYNAVSGNVFLQILIVTTMSISAACLLAYFAFDYPPDPWPKHAPATRSTDMDIFRIKLGIYQDRLKQLDANLKLQGFFAVIALAVMTSRKKSLEVPMFRINIPSKALFLLLPMVSLFLWLQFGYLLSHLIDTRISMFHLASSIVPPIAGDSVLTAKSHGLQSALNDGGYLDAWFRAFHPEYTVGFESKLVNRIGNGLALFIVYGALLGAAHAAILYTLYLGSKHRTAPDGQQLNTAPIATVHMVLLVIIGTLLALTHIQFYVANANKNWQHVGIGFFLVLFVLTLHHTIDALNNEQEEHERTFASQRLAAKRPLRRSIRLQTASRR